VFCGAGGNKSAAQPVVRPLWLFPDESGEQRALLLVKKKVTRELEYPSPWADGITSDEGWEAPLCLRCFGT
jgi:hypothetical protein